MALEINEERLFPQEQHLKHSLFVSHAMYQICKVPVFFLSLGCLTVAIPRPTQGPDFWERASNYFTEQGAWFLGSLFLATLCFTWFNDCRLKLQLIRARRAVACFGKEGATANESTGM